MDWFQRITSRKFPILLFLCLLGCDVINFLLQKNASNRATGEGWSYLASLLTHYWMWIALAIAPLQLWIWTSILSRVELSLAQPLTSLSYPITLLAAVCFLGEHLSWQVWTGAILITAGAMIMGSKNESSNAETNLDDGNVAVKTRI